jgi:hypothetical protein
MAKLYGENARKGGPTGPCELFATRTADIAAGLATGILGVALARRIDGAIHGTV